MIKGTENRPFYSMYQHTEFTMGCITHGVALFVCLAEHMENLVSVGVEVGVKNQPVKIPGTTLVVIAI